MPETSYDDIRYRLHELDHAYGDRVHIVAEPYLLTLLEKLCSPNTGQPEVARLVEQCYRALLIPVVNQELPRVTVTRDTRMIDSSPRGRYANTQVKLVAALIRPGWISSARRKCDTA